jgi:hypothetical protein
MIDKEIQIFINEIKTYRKDIDDEMLRILKDFIKDSGCKKIKFDSLSNKIMGLSIYDKCILNKNLLLINIEYFFYILLHEISHQFQYKKYGKNLTKDIYIDKLDVSDAVNKLMNLEKTADRLAIKKMNYIAKYSKIQFNEITPRYLNLEDKDYFYNHIIMIREKISEKKCKTIDEINKVLYGYYKV